MLLPVLIFLPDVKKNLDNSDRPTIKLGLREQMYGCYQSAIDQLYLCPLFADIISKISYFLRCLSLNFSDNFTFQYFYVFACQEQIPEQFLMQMTQVDRQILLQQLKSDYRQILIDYFTTDKTLKEKIDKFINALFYANIPVPQIIEIHMELIEEFSKQLKLEGRSDEALLDYRLTLIDILAHLCEVYRCSVSK
ncbi:KaiA family protein [Nostoc sp. NIES-4103]|nr:KaiA family protein [Nostoc sp. NIES-4103]